jgi:RNA polymerase sigma-70 factor (ECF subfamily)
MAQTKAEYQSLGDRELVLAFKQGDGSAYDEIFRRHHARVEVTCTRLLGRQDAEEATQETFLRAFQALPRFNGQFYLSAWLTRIATNVCVDYLRSRSRTNLIILPDVPETSAQNGPEEIIGITSPRLERTMKEVQPSYAHALALRALAGMSHTEMANRLAMSPQQVKALLHRARSSFKKAWDRAEGWAMAPLFALRNLMDERSSSTGSSVAGASPFVTAMTVERVATSVLIVATALTAVPAASSIAAAPAQFGSVQAGESLDPRPAEETAKVGTTGHKVATEADAMEETSSELLALPPLGPLADVRRSQEQDDSADGPSDGDSTPRPGGAESREALRKARDAAKKAAELIDHV